MNVKKGVVAGFFAGIAMRLSGIVIFGAILGEPWESIEHFKLVLLNILDTQIQMWVLTIIEGVLYGIVYSVLYSGIPGRNVNKGLIFAVILWIIVAVPNMAYINMPTLMNASWLFGGLINLLVMGAVLAFVYEKVK
jgi:hypothetical protein